MAHPFRAAVEARDLDAMKAALSPDVTFNSPVAFKPFEGIDAVWGVLEAVMGTFEDFGYTDELEAPDGTHALIFQARVGDKQLEGIDLLRMGDDGLIEDFTVMVRPVSGLMALGEAMGPKVAALKD